MIELRPVRLADVDDSFQATRTVAEVAGMAFVAIQGRDGDPMIIRQRLVALQPDTPVFFCILRAVESGRGIRNDAGKHIVGQRFEFLPCGRLHLDGAITHAADRVLQVRL